MASVCFLQSEERAAKKIAPLLQKKGYECFQVSVDDWQQLNVKPADIIILDIKTPGAEIFSNLKGLKKPAQIVVITQSSDAGQLPDDVVKSAPGDVVKTVLNLKGAAPKTEAAPSADSNIEAIIAGKSAKVREIKSRGVDPYPHRFAKKSQVAEILRLGAPLQSEQHSGKEVTTAGRVMQMRLMGKAAFFHLQDGSGKAQAYVKSDVLGAEKFEHFKGDVQIGDFVGVTGEVFKTKTGEPTVAAKEITLLAKALRPLPEKWHGLQDTELRSRNRHLDLISNPESRKVFEARSKIVESIRRTMSELGYLEVETPILLSHAGGASATPFKTFHHALSTEMTLRIATELYLKRLIIGGFERVYEIGRIFRNEGIDTRHNPEFTMMEAYAAYQDYHAMAEFFEKVLSNAAAALGIDSIDYRGEKISLKPPFRRLYLPELWQQKCGEDIHNILEGKGFNRANLLKLAAKLKIDAGDATPSAKVFERIFDDRILPELAQPAFVMDHPTAITPLAKCKPGDVSIVERFEFFIGTEEMANAYTELNDPEDQRDRLQEQMRQKQSGNEEADILDEEFVQAMECGMPPTGGIGIGIDRMAMVLTGHPSIREVILFPTLKPEGQ